MVLYSTALASNLLLRIDCLVYASSGCALLLGTCADFSMYAAKDHCSNNTADFVVVFFAPSIYQYLLLSILTILKCRGTKHILTFLVSHHICIM